jgi:ABC-type phosphate/phosphonate transport system substrate-binding protein
MRLTPILSEAERFGDEETDAARYAVAVVRADSGIQSIVDLRGKRSCHGSVSSLTGWNIPLIVLRDSGLIYPQQCQFGRALSSFFASSCVPGARDPNLRLPESLCSLCVGASLGSY